MTDSTVRLDDAALLERWRAGDQRAGEQLFERYYASVERFFINKVNTHVADLVQETFIACVESRDRLHDPHKFRSFLFTVAHNTLYGHIRRTYRQGRTAELDSLSMHDLSPGPGSVAVRASQMRLLLEALRRIPVRYQILLELFYWEEMKTAEMAVILDIPVGTVRSRIQKARRLLEQAMDQIENQPEILATTKSSLDDWAGRCRQHFIQTATRS